MNKPRIPGLVLLRLFAFLAFGGDSLGGRDGPFGCLADAFGALAFAVLVAAPCRAVVEFHEGRPVEAFVRQFAEIGDFRTGFGLDLGFELAARRGGKTGLKVEPELLLFTPEGQESAEYQRIYHH